jgi:hypothetical protein
MIININIKISGSGDPEGNDPHGILDYVEELDRAIEETNGRVDSLEAQVAQGDRPDEPTFGTDVDDSEL